MVQLQNLFLSFQQEFIRLLNRGQLLIKLEVLAQGC